MSLNVGSVIFGIGIVGTLAFDVESLIFYRKQRAETAKYRYFAVRDKFIELVASDIIQEDDPLFQRFYQATNSLINHSKRLDFGQFVEALDMISEEDGLIGFDKLDAELSHRNPQVREVVMLFFQTVMDTLMENSAVLRISLAYQHIFKLIRPVGRAYRWLWENVPPTVRALTLYRVYATVAQAVHINIPC